MAIFGGTGACLAFGSTYQIGSEVTVINDTGEVYVNFKIPVRSQANDIDPNQTLSQAIADLGADDSDNTLYGGGPLNGACQILVNLYGNYYEGCTSRMFSIQTHHTDQANPNNRVKISNTATGEYRLNVGTGGSDPEYWSNITFDMYLLNGSAAAPYVGNQTYDSRYGQDQAWK